MAFKRGKMKTKCNYILKGKKAVPEYDLLKWAKWFETADRQIADNTIGKVRVSTVFLGVDHNCFAGGKPVLFETMIFGGKHDDYQERYHTWQEGKEGHKKALKLVKIKRKKRKNERR